MNKARSISISSAFEALSYLPDRTPLTSDDDAKDAFAMLADYRDGAIFIAHYAGDSQWERHGNGDEIVMVLEGETNLILLLDAVEQPNRLRANEFLVVPQNVWHRFESPLGVKVLSVTPQPTDHSVDRPE